MLMEQAHFNYSRLVSSATQRIYQLPIIIIIPLPWSDKWSWCSVFFRVKHPKQQMKTLSIGSTISFRNEGLRNQNHQRVFEISRKKECVRWTTFDSFRPSQTYCIYDLYLYSVIECQRNYYYLYIMSYDLGPIGCAPFEPEASEPME